MSSCGTTLRSAESSSRSLPVNSPLTNLDPMWGSKIAAGLKRLLFLPALSSPLAAPTFLPAQAIINKIAGTETAGCNGDEILALSAELNTPFSVAVDSAGNIYIPYTYNQRISKVDNTGNITTVVGNGTVGTGSQLNCWQLNYPFGVGLRYAGLPLHRRYV